MTGMETLINVLEKFGDYGEPVAILIVWTDTNGDVRIKTNCGHTHTVGMAEYAKNFALQVLFQQDEEEPRA
jgi:hypothetical protein